VTVGSDTGLAQDATLQAIIVALGGPIVGMPNGSGTGAAQDASLQQILALLAGGVGSVTSVSGAAPITSTLGTTPIIGITAATDLAAGSMSAVDKAKLDAITPGGGATGIFGDGSDGDFTVDGTATFPGAFTVAGALGSYVYTQIRDTYFRNLTINVGKTMLGGSFRTFVSGTFANHGSLNVNGYDGADGSFPGNQGGAPLGSLTTLGQAGVGNNAPQSTTNSLGGSGGVDSNGDSAGTATQVTAGAGGVPRDVVMAVSGRSFGGGTGVPSIINGGAGGSGGNGPDYGGGGGGVLMLVAATPVGAGSITANGGAGQNGAFASGAGGGGGYVVFIYHDKSGFSGTVSANGGANGGRTSQNGFPGTVVQLSA
jgi:hypothetical protein